MAALLGEPAFHTRNQRKRLWLRIHLTADTWKSIKGRLTKVIPTFDATQFDALDNTALVYLPIAAGIPAATFKHEYTQLLGDIDMTTRVLAQLGGSAMESFGKAIAKNFGSAALTGGAAKAVGGGIEKVGSLIETLGGNTDSTRLWNKASTEDIAISGTIGITCFEEYKYYESAKLILQAAVAPTGIDDSLATIKQTITDLAGALNAQSKILEQWTPYTMQAPANDCTMQLVVGEEIPWQQKTVARGTDRLKATLLHRPILFALGACKIATMDFTEGTDEGRGIADDGSSRIMDYEVTFAPNTLAEVHKGMELVWKSIDFEKQKANANKDDRGVLGKNIDLTNNILFYALNTGLVVSYPGVKLAKLYNATVGTVMLLLNKGVEGLNVGIGYARAVKQVLPSNQRAQSNTNETAPSKNRN